MARLRAWLASPRWPWLAAALAVALHLPAVDAGFQLDDHAHRLTLTRAADLGFERPWWAMFDFIGLDRPEARPNDRELIDRGVLPWWTEPDLSIAFWRPIAAATHAVDFVLWPDRPAIHHLHSLAWLALATVLVGVLLRRWIAPAWVAGLATLAFALDDHHWAMAGWISNRNALVGLAFGVGALILHDRWRREGRRIDGVMAPLAFGLALLSNEGAVAVGAFLVGHALWLDRGTLRSRVVALLPAVAVGVAWLAARVALGIGIEGSVLYVDPLRDPVAFAEAVVDHLPILLSGVWLFPGAEIAPLLAPADASALRVRGILLTVLCGWILLPVLRRRPEARVLTLGAAAALLPACATLPAGRLLAFTGVGAAAWLALPVADLRPDHRVRHGLALLLLVIHLLIGAPLIVLGLDAFADLEGRLRGLADSLPSDPAVEHQTVILVQAPSGFLASFPPMIQHERGRPIARRQLVLTPGLDGVTVERPDERTLVLRPEPAGSTDTPRLDPRRVARRLDDLLRRSPFTVGETVRLPDATVTVTAVDDGRPVEITARFDRPLEDPSHRWLTAEGWSYRPFVVPPVGGSGRVEAVLPER